MIAFNDGWESAPPMTEDMAKKLLMSMLYAKTFPPNAPSTPSLHISEYIDYMMYEKDYKILSLTIEKDESKNLVFNIHYKEK